MNTLVLKSPLAGWSSRLAEIPDPAFAEGMIGDGVAIDPISNELVAPCDGTIVSVHSARHACTLRADSGAEILLHIGIDTVELRGEGFAAHVSAGQRVRTGDRLITFDIELIARKAKSFLSPVILVSGAGYEVTERVQDRQVAAGDALLTIVGGAQPADAAEEPAQGGGAAERRARLLTPQGLHARPAGAFARRARRHAGAVTVACRARTANGKSLVSLMALDARQGDTLTIRTTGAHADETAAELAALVTGELGDASPPRLARQSSPSTGGRVVPIGRDSGPSDPARPIRSGSGARGGQARASGSALEDADRAMWAGSAGERGHMPPVRPGEELILVGSAAAPGLAVGRAVRLVDDMPAPVRDGAGAGVEEDRLRGALYRLRRDLEQTIADAPPDAVSAEIFRAHLDLLDDPALASAAGREIAAGRSAAWAWRAGVQESAATLRGLDNPLLVERAGDLDDLERRVLALLAGQSGRRVPAELPPDGILVADEIRPSDLAGAASVGRLAGICTAGGGPTSHAAILASSMGIPAVVALGDAALHIPEGAPLIVDGDRGQVRVFPGARAAEQAERDVAKRSQRRRANLSSAREAGRTADGVSIGVFANLGRPAEAVGAVEQGAEGCGLLRSEFLFLDRQTAPSEDEQAAAYQEVAGGLAGQPLVIRLLDAGGDKPLAYLPADREDNPALGMRGVRLALHHPELLRAQVRAILRVAPAGVCRILVPMVTGAAELSAVRAVVEEERRALRISEPISLGAMIEVPVAAIQAGSLARAADFFSIGTNDLTQYTLAMDRGHPLLAGHLDSLHPGILHLMASTVSAARAYDRPVAVCGGAAADVQAIPILVGLGVGTLSTAPAFIPELKALLRTLTLPRCIEVAERALELDSAEAVRALVVGTWGDLAAPDARRMGGEKP